MELTKEQVQEILKNKPTGFSNIQVLSGLTNRGFTFQGVDMNAARQFAAGQMPQQPIEQKKSSLERASNIVSSIFPGKKIGEAIGTAIAKRSESGQELQTQEEQGLVPQGTTAQTFQAPTGAEVAGDLLQIGAFFVPVGKAAAGVASGAKALGLGAKTAQTIGNIAAGAGTGYVADVGMGLAEGETGSEAFTPGIGTTIGAAIPAVAPVARGLGKITKEVVGKTTGAGVGALEQGFKAAKTGGEAYKTFKEALRGKTNPEQIVEEAKSGLQTIKQARTNAYVSKLEEITKNNTKSYDISPVVEEVGNQLDKFGVKVADDGTLDFSRSTLRFNKPAQQDIQTIVEEMKGFGLQEGDRTVVGIDSLKRALGDLYTPSGEARAFVQGVKSKVRGVLSDVPGYDDLTKNYEESTSIIDEIQKGLSLGDKASIDTSYKKLTSALRANNELRKEFIQELDNATDGQLLSKIAGQQLSETLPKGLAGTLTTVGGGLGLASGIGVVPLLSAALTTSPRVVGEIIQALGFTSRKAGQVLKLIEKNAGKLQFPGDMLMDKAKPLTKATKKNL